MTILPVKSEIVKPFDFSSLSCPIETISFDTLPSTQIWCLENCQNLFEERRLSETKWIRVVTKHQTGGIGQPVQGSAGQNYKWLDSEGAIKVSFIFIADPAILPSIPVIACCSLLQCFRSVYNIPVMMKWKNDLMLNGKKVAGILTNNISIRSTTKSITSIVIVGVGINVDISQSNLDCMIANLDHKQPISSLSCEEPKLKIDLQDILNNISYYLYLAISTTIPSSLDKFAKYANKYLYKKGEAVCIINESHQSDRLDTRDDFIYGKIVGIHPSCTSFEICDKNNTILQIQSGKMIFTNDNSQKDLI